MAGKTAHFRELLRQREAVLVEAVRGHLDDAGRDRRDQALRDVTDTKDGSFREVITTVRQAGLMREAEELEDIRGALRRMDSGRYGICIVCEEAIPDARLEAWPTAKRCRPCQEEREAEKARGR